MAMKHMEYWLAPEPVICHFLGDYFEKLKIQLSFIRLGFAVISMIKSSYLKKIHCHIKICKGYAYDDCFKISSLNAISCNMHCSINY
ncbi:hypothetical protein BpHYR1_030198 [Brachionus plicatilis]|uniref:Uncharacterized protein n=1 Tax=Brachionus plicatilis TaxID=10195 RepID=A0A3M7RND3_BRAPC|nr:hypothetical protein BpHYR1_030198 [Brachionus plicatilis]